MKVIKNFGLIVPVTLTIFLFAACGSAAKSAVQPEKPAEKAAETAVAAKPAEKTATVEAKGNLIKNGTFDNMTEIMKISGYDVPSSTIIEKTASIGYWHLLAGANGNGKAEIVNGTCKIKIFAPGDQTYGVQLSQLPVAIEKGKTYTVSFDASADEPRPIVVRIGQVGPPWTAYSGDQKFNLTKEMKNYTFTFTMNTITDEKCRLDFNLGLAMAAVTIDNVVVTKAE